MLLSIGLMLGALFLLIAAMLLFRAEAAAGRRFLLEKTRERADIAIIRRQGNKGLRHYIGASSLRLVIHFVLHKVLGGALAVVRFAEDRLDYLRRHNRLIARGVEISREGTHFHQIAAHKEAMALTPKEKAALKARYLND